ncbi:MAG: SGNH/GDSL hydrolase family protein, partial [Lentisphaerota bacterium]
KTPDVGFSIKTKVYPIGLDTWAPKAGQNPAAEDFYTVAEGLKNDKHTLEIIPNGDGPLPLRAVVVYKPSLK